MSLNEFLYKFFIKKASLVRHLLRRLSCMKCWRKNWNLLKKIKLED